MIYKIEKYYRLIFILCILFVPVSKGQTKGSKEEEGKITYLTRNNVYVKFKNKINLNKGDVLYLKEDGKLIKAITVKYVSSFKCSGEPFNNIKLKIGEKLYAFVNSEVHEKKLTVKKNTATVTKEKKLFIVDNQTDKKEKVSSSRRSVKETKEEFSGRFRVGSGISYNDNKYNSTWWRYSLSYNYENIKGSNFSTEGYFTYRYNTKNWNEISNKIFEPLNVYSFSVNYNGENSILKLGRTFNSNLSSIGSIDGLQWEYSFSKNYLGVILGSRPNFSDYGYNAKLFQYGVYFSRNDTLSNSFISNTLAFINQTNNFNTDRRFLYFQTKNNLIKNTYFFLSSEIDLYKRENQIEKNDFKLTSLYGYLRYSPNYKFSLSLSYDERKTIRYYETYKSIADSIWDNSTRYGFTGRMNVRPARYLSMYLSYGYRFKSGDINKSNNEAAGLTYSRIPFINVSTSIRYTHLKTNYLDGNTYSITARKSFLEGNLTCSAGFRHVNYKYLSTSFKLIQNIISADIYLNVLDNLYLGLYMESIKSDFSTSNRFDTTLSYRF